MKTVKKSPSLFQLRLRKFRSLKRGYYCFLALVFAYVLSFFLPFLMGDRAIMVHYQGENYFPAARSYLNQTFGYFDDRVYDGAKFGQPPHQAQADYRNLALKFNSPEQVKDLLRSQRDIIESSAEDRLGDRFTRLKVAQRQAALTIRFEKLKASIEDIEPAEKLHEKLVVASSEAASALFQIFEDPDDFDKAERQRAAARKKLDTRQKEVAAVLEEMKIILEDTPDLKGNFVVMPFIPYSPYESFEGSEDRPQPPNPPSAAHWLGTDDRGRDIMVRLAYGFRVSMSFAILVTSLEYFVGTIIGALLGYFGKWVDILGVRFVEIWAAIPVLYTIMILADRLGRSFPLLVLLLSAFSWYGIAYYVRGEFLREKAKDYVAAARAIGEGELSIMFRHILPNALTPIIAFAPFAIVGNISALLALDYLGFGLPTETPSWGELIGQGKAQITQWYIVTFPILMVFFTLQFIVFIGEAVREAFDPKVFSKLQ